MRYSLERMLGEKEKDWGPIYPKIKVGLQIEINSGGVTIPDPNDNNVLAAVKVIHDDFGLIGKYDWFDLKGKELRDVGNGVARAEREENLLPPFLIPLDDLRIEVTGRAFDTVFLGRAINWMTFFNVTYFMQDGSSDVRYEQVYNSPKSGFRDIVDVIKLQN